MKTHTAEKILAIGRYDGYKNYTCFKKIFQVLNNFESQRLPKESVSSLYSHKKKLRFTTDFKIDKEIKKRHIKCLYNYGLKLMFVFMTNLAIKKYESLVTGIIFLFTLK